MTVMEMSSYGEASDVALLSSSVGCKMCPFLDDMIRINLVHELKFWGGNTLNLVCRFTSPNSYQDSIISITRISLLACAQCTGLSLEKAVISVFPAYIPSTPDMFSVHISVQVGHWCARLGGQLLVYFVPYVSREKV